MTNALLTGVWLLILFLISVTVWNNLAIRKVRQGRDSYKQMLSRYRTEELNHGSNLMAENAVFQGLFDNRSFKPDFGVIHTSGTWNNQVRPWMESELLYLLFEACNAPDDRSKLARIERASAVLDMILKPQKEIGDIERMEKFNQEQRKHAPSRRP